MFLLDEELIDKQFPEWMDHNSEEAKSILDLSAGICTKNIIETGSAGLIYEIRIS